jgi:hypothetical protein
VDSSIHYADASHQSVWEERPEVQGAGRPIVDRIGHQPQNLLFEKPQRHAAYAWQTSLIANAPLAFAITNSLANLAFSISIARFPFYKDTVARQTKFFMNRVTKIGFASAN